MWPQFRNQFKTFLLIINFTSFARKFFPRVPRHRGAKLTSETIMLCKNMKCFCIILVFAEFMQKKLLHFIAKNWQLNNLSKKFQCINLYCFLDFNIKNKHNFNEFYLGTLTLRAYFDYKKLCIAFFITHISIFTKFVLLKATNPQSRNN